MWYVYILKCKDGSMYTGATVNVEARFRAHMAGKGGAYTRTHRPVKIVHVEKFRTRGQALRREAAIKRLERRQKFALIRGR